MYYVYRQYNNSISKTVFLSCLQSNCATWHNSFLPKSCFSYASLCHLLLFKRHGGIPTNQSILPWCLGKLNECALDYTLPSLCKHENVAFVTGALLHNNMPDTDKQGRVPVCTPHVIEGLFFNCDLKIKSWELLAITIERLTWWGNNLSLWILQISRRHCSQFSFNYSHGVFPALAINILPVQGLYIDQHLKRRNYDFPKSTHKCYPTQRVHADADTHATLITRVASTALVLSSAIGMFFLYQFTIEARPFSADQCTAMCLDMGVGILSLSFLMSTLFWYHTHI